MTAEERDTFTVRLADGSSLTRHLRGPDGFYRNPHSAETAIRRAREAGDAALEAEAQAGLMAVLERNGSTLAEYQARNAEINRLALAIGARVVKG